MEEEVEEEREVRDEEYGEMGGEGEKHRAEKGITAVSKSRFFHFYYDFENNIFYPRHLDLSKMELTEIHRVRVHRYLVSLNVSGNYLTNSGLTSLIYLQNLVHLYLTKNEITSVQLPLMSKLQLLHLDNNPIRVISNLGQPNLEILVLNNTKISQITQVDTRSIPLLVTLSIANCNISSMKADYAQTLTYLFLGNNQINRIEGIEFLINLKVLHLRNNKVSLIEGLSSHLERLEYINLRENNLVDPNELKKFRILPNLKVLIISENPVSDEMGEDIRPMVLMYSLGVLRLNKILTTPADIEYASALLSKEEAKEEGEEEEEEEEEQEEEEINEEEIKSSESTSYN